MPWAVGAAPVIEGLTHRLRLNAGSIAGHKTSA